MTKVASRLSSPPSTKRIPRSTSFTGPASGPMINSKRRSTPGKLFLKAAMRGITQCVVKPVESDSVTVWTPCWRSLISLNACWMPAKLRSIALCKILPYSVSVTPFVVRMKSCTSKCSSRRPIIRLIAAGVTFSSWAALEKLPCRAAASSVKSPFIEGRARRRIVITFCNIASSFFQLHLRLLFVLLPNKKGENPSSSSGEQNICLRQVPKRLSTHTMFSSFIESSRSAWSVFLIGR